MQDALALIVANPHRVWHTQTELQSCWPAVAEHLLLSRAVTRPGSRVSDQRAPASRVGASNVERRRTEATFDSVPNRFVKYALERWRTIAQQLLDAMSGADRRAPGPVRRGRRVAREVQEQLDHVLAAPLFAEVGELDVFPSSNQVLHKQQGYREIFQTFALAEVGAGFSLDLDVDDVFAASQRNVATLYEYWAFLQLVEAVGAVCGERRTVDALASSSDGLSLGFKQGRESGVKWETAAGGRRLEVEVFFNRHFRSSMTSSADSSWSRAMRPDCSRSDPSAAPASRTSQPGSLDVWLHFDAKYRVERAREQFDAGAEEPRVGRGRGRDDRAARPEQTRRPAEDARVPRRDPRFGRRVRAFPGDARRHPFASSPSLCPASVRSRCARRTATVRMGSEALEAFLREALDHVADRASQDERYRYWRAVVRGRREHGSRDREIPDLAVPPRDALVLCCEFANPDELEWTVRMQMYAMPADAESGECRRTPVN